MGVPGILRAFGCEPAPIVESAGLKPGHLEDPDTRPEDRHRAFRRRHGVADPGSSQPVGARRPPHRAAATTGRILTESDFFEPLSINSLATPGFGGRVYFPTAVGKGFVVLQVLPKGSPPSG